MNKRYLALEGDTFSTLAERLYKVVQLDGTILERERATVECTLKHANPGLEGPLHAGDEVMLPPISDISWVDIPRIEKPDDLRPYARQIADRINRDRVLGVLFLMDPARVLVELGYELSAEVKAVLRRPMLGVTRAQMEEYDHIRQRLKDGEIVSGFVSVRLRPSEGGSFTPGPEQNDQTSTLEHTKHLSNPVDGYDMVVEVDEEVIERVIQLAYEDNVIPHRPSLPPDMAAMLPGQLVLGRPKSVSFNPPTPNGILLVLPIALVTAAGAYHVDVTIEAMLSVEEENGRPACFHIALTKDPVATGSGAQVSLVNLLLAAQRQKIETALNNILQTYSLTAQLDKLAKAGILSSMNLSVDDLELKINNPPGPQVKRSLSACVNFSPHNGTGLAQNVGQFMAQHWAIGVNERMLHQVFDDWWKSPEAKQYQRLSKSKLESFESLSKNHRLSEIFDPNGSIRITGIEFSCGQKYIDLTVNLAVGDVWLWDVDATVTAKVWFAIDPITSEFQITVTDVDTSLSCLSKFLIGLFCFVMGFIGGAIVGGIVGAAIGGIVGGVLVGAAVGAAIGGTAVSLIATIIGQVIIALEEAAINQKLNNLGSIGILKVRFDWQIPQTTLVLHGRGEWATVLPGEVLMGGTMNMPPLDTPSADILLSQWVDSREDVKLPWAQAPVPMGNYFVYTTAHYIANPRLLLEEPLSFRWFMDGVEIEGDGDEVELTVTPSVDLALRPKADEGMWVLEAAGVRIRKSIQVIRKDGSKAPPHIFTEFVGEKLQAFASYALKVVVTDVLGSQAQAELKTDVKMLGDYWSDMVNRIESYQPITKEPIPQPPELWLPMPELRGLPARVVVSLDAKAGFRRPELVVNISGAICVSGEG